MPDKIKQAVLCFSGGMDSTSLLYHLLAQANQVTVLSFDYGQKHRYELACVSRQLVYLRESGFSVDHQQIDFSEFGKGLSSALTSEDQAVPRGHYEADSMRETVVPNRNAIFFSFAAAKALSISQTQPLPVKLSLAVHSGDHEIYPDCRPEFYQAIWNSFQIGNWDSENVELYLPYLELGKAEVLADAQVTIKQLGLDFNAIFANTCTSYLPDQAGKSHGLTGSDVERILAFNSLGLVDPIEYQQRWPDVLEQALQVERSHRQEQ